MISKLSIGGFQPTQRDTNYMYGDPVKQLKADVEEIAQKVNQIIEVLNAQERQSRASTDNRLDPEF